MEITFYRKLADKVTGAVVQNQSYSDSEIKKIRYGLVCIFSDLYKFILYLIIFSVFSLTTEFFIAFIGIMLLRPFLGGYHSKNEVICIFMSFGTLLVSILLGNKNIIPDNLHLILIFLLPLVGALIAPVRVKKAEEKKSKYKLLTVVLTAFSLLVDYLLLKNQILLVSVLLIYFLALYQYAKNMKNQHIF